MEQLGPCTVPKPLLESLGAATTEGPAPPACALQPEKPPQRDPTRCGQRTPSQAATWPPHGKGESVLDKHILSRSMGNKAQQFPDVSVPLF